MYWVMLFVSTVCVVAGAVLLFIAAVIVIAPRWYQRSRWFRPPSGPEAPFFSAPFTLSAGRKRSSLYFWAGGGAPYDDSGEKDEGSRHAK